MPRLSREQLRNLEEQQRHVVTTRPMTVGGFPWAAALPFLAAAATPLLSSGAKWVGKKVFGQGLMRAGGGLQRAGERLPSSLGTPFKTTVAPKIPIIYGRGAYRAGDYPMPTMAPLPHHKSATTGGLPGAGVTSNPLPVRVRRRSAKGTKKGSTAMKAKMAALRAMKKKA